jgi:hypothetical protein
MSDHLLPGLDVFPLLTIMAANRLRRAGVDAGSPRWDRSAHRELRSRVDHVARVARQIWDETDALLSDAPPPLQSFVFQLVADVREWVATGLAFLVKYPDDHVGRRRRHGFRCRVTFMSLTETPPDAAMVIAWRSTDGHIVRRMDLLLGRVRGMAEPDGPMPPNRLVHKNMTVNVEPLPWKLLSVLWSSNTLLESDVESAVWGDAASGDALKRAIARANAALLKVNSGRSITRQNGYVTLS